MPGSLYCLPLSSNKKENMKNTKKIHLYLEFVSLYENIYLCTINFTYLLPFIQPLKRGLSAWPFAMPDTSLLKAYCETSFLYALESVYSLTRNILPRERVWNGDSNINHLMVFNLKFMYPSKCI